MASSSMFADSIDPIVQLIESFSPKRPSISGPSPFSDLDDHDTLQFLYEFDMHAHSGSVENTVYPSDSSATLQEDLDSLTESPPQLTFSDSDYSPVSTISHDLAASHFQHESPLSHDQSSLGLENIALYSHSTPTSPLVGISELSNLPNTPPVASRTSTPEGMQEDSIITASGSDAGEADVESEGEVPAEEGEPSEYGDSDSSDDDEYVPIVFTRAKRGTRAKPMAKAPRPRPSSSTTRSKSSRGRRSPRYSPYTSPSPAPSFSSLSSSSEPGSPGHRTAQLRHTSSRKKQVSRADASSQPRNGASRWGCPHCKYVQQNHRMPDLRRHIAGHCKTDDFVCCGVPIALAEEYGVPADSLSDVQEWKGELRVGGCWQVCSRRDALIRHLKNKKRTCVCDVLPNDAFETFRKRR